MGACTKPHVHDYFHSWDKVFLAWCIHQFNKTKKEAETSNKINEVPESRELSKEERIVLQRNQRELVQNSVSGAHHHRHRGGEHHLRRPIPAFPTTLRRESPHRARTRRRHRRLLLARSLPRAAALHWRRQSQRYCRPLRRAAVVDLANRGGPWSATEAELAGAGDWDAPAEWRHGCVTQFENWKRRERERRENGSEIGSRTTHMSHVGAKVKSETERSNGNRNVVCVCVWRNVVSCLKPRLVVVVCCRILGNESWNKIK